MPSRFNELWNDTAYLRNQTAHAGMDRGAKPTGQLLDQMKNVLEKVADYLYAPVSSLASMDDRQSGVVKWYDPQKGFGFIIPDRGCAKPEDGDDVFVHYGVVESAGYDTLEEGERVEYDVKDTPKGFEARNLKRT
jgi:cold shock CspA family protein